MQTKGHFGPCLSLTQPLVFRMDARREVEKKIGVKRKKQKGEKCLKDVHICTYMYMHIYRLCVAVRVLASSLLLVRTHFMRYTVCMTALLGFFLRLFV